MASSGSDTEMDGELSSEYSGSLADTPEESPRDDPAAPPLGRAEAPNPRVPRLALNLAGLPRADGPAGDGGPPTARQGGAGAVPRLALPARAADSGAAPPSARTRPSLPLPAAVLPALPPPAQQHASPPPPAQQQQRQHCAVTSALTLDIISTAFTVEPSQRQGGGGELLAQHCAGRLGVPPDRLRYYQLVEVAGPQHLPPGCTRAAVEVIDSRCTLAEMEGLLAENHQLQADNRQLRLALAAATGAEQQQQQGSGQQPEVVELERAQQENRALQERLKCSESKRSLAVRVLRTLKRDFEQLTSALLGGMSTPLQLKPAGGAALPVWAPREKEGTPVALADGLQQL